MQCQGCGRVIELATGERIAFSETCEGCGLDLHSCQHCAHHDPTAYNECRESSAERVEDRERANRCEYFRPGAGGAERGDQKQQALDDLEALFKKR